jgi:photosystem II stability/assembly factor-like uncharacterized protein
MRRIWAATFVTIALACLGAVAASPARAYVPDGNQGWYWQMPQPAGTLSDVTFADASDVWAVGMGGTILHSTDAGATWSAQQSGTLAELDSVSFADAQHGWVCGNSDLLDPGIGTLLATTDGGASWTDRTPSGLSAALSNVSFVDAQDGWVGTSSGHVLRTTDGGASWTSARVGNSRRFLGVDFVDAARGWAFNGNTGALWRTTDGGTVWDRVHRFDRRDDPGVGVDFVDRSHGWAYYATYIGNVPTSTILVTRNAGKTWRPVRSFVSCSIEGLEGASRSDVAFISERQSGDVPDNFGGLAALSSSSDAGAHWTTRTIGLSVQPWSIAGNGASLCVVGYGIAASSDEGVTWRAASSGQLYFLDDGIAVSNTDLWAVDDFGALLHSSNGTSWTEQANPVRYAEELRAVSFPDASNGWVVGETDSFPHRGVILHTTDGGASWSPQASSLDGELVGCDFVDAANGWAISDDPGEETGAMTAIEHTTDGGQSWLAQHLSKNTDAGLDALSFISDSTGWACGERFGPGTAVYKTTDGGQSWTQENLPSEIDNLWGLQFLDAAHGWALGMSYSQSGTPDNWLMQTTDGGSSWTRVTLPSAADYLTSVHFVDAQHGWVGGDAVWQTTDGGATWTKVAYGGFGAIAATDTSHAWAFGAGIVATVDGGGGDTAPPQTLDNADWGWHRRPVTITLTANDAGGSGLAETQFSSDGGTTWQSGTSIAVPAPADHTNDGLRSFLYRSSDNAGNVEATEICGVGIDTLGPTCAAPKEAVADVGKPVVVRFKASDATSGVARVTITIATRGGRTVERFVRHSGDWDGSRVPYYWLSFTCKLEPGSYRIVVRATDRAGNRQVTVGRNWLRVVLTGAPAASHPGWPAGLPDTTPQTGSPELGGLADGLLGTSAASLLRHNSWKAGSHLLSRN